MAAEPLLCGIDAGTTRIRALLFTPDGRLVAEGSRPTPVERPRPGWAEHDPEALWQATCGALREATARIDEPARIAGLAVASVGEAFVALDRARPADLPDDRLVRRAADSARSPGSSARSAASRCTR